MSVFLVQCPKCGTALEADEQYIGVQVACCDCSYRFILKKNLNTQIDLKDGEDLISLNDIDKTLAYTKPLRLFIDGSKYSLSNWKDVLRILVSWFLTATPDKLSKLINISFSKFSKRVCLQSTPDKLAAAIQISENLWVETNFSAQDIVRLSQEITALCDFDPSAVKIVYIPKETAKKQSGPQKGTQKISGVELPKEKTIDDGCQFVKILDWAFLTSGVTIPVKNHQKFLDNLSQKLPIGKSINVSLFFESRQFIVSMNNVAFTKSTRTVIQFRWSKNSPIAQALQQKFASIYDALLKNRQNKDVLTKNLIIGCSTNKNEFIISLSDAVEPETQKPQRETLMETDAEFSVFSNFDFTYAFLKKLYADNFDFSTDAKELQTLQWCQHNLNLRLPLLRKLRAFESADDYKETFVLLEGSAEWMVCRLQNNLNRCKFLVWANENGFALADIAEMLGVKIAMAQDIEAKVQDVPNDDLKRTSISDTDLLVGGVSSLYKRQFLTGHLFSDFQATHYCLKNFGVSKPIICRHYPYMREEDFGKDYQFWVEGPLDQPYLILHNCSGFNRRAFIFFIQNMGLLIEDLATDLNCDMSCLSLKPQNDSFLNPHQVTCDTAIYNFLDKHPGVSRQNIIAALTASGHDMDKIIRRLERLKDIVCIKGRYFHKTSSSDASEDIVSVKLVTEEYTVQKFVSNDEIDRMLLDFVTKNPGQKKEKIVNHLVGQDIPEKRAKSRLRNHDKVFCIVEQYYCTDGIYGFEEAADVIWKTLNELFDQNDGHTSARELYRAVSGELDDFFYDNDAFDSEVEIYQFAQYLFEKEQYKSNAFEFFNKIHIWRERPPYPMGDSGLLIHWAKGNNGILTINAAYTNLLRRGVTEGNKTAIFSLAMDKVYDRFWMIDSDTFLLKDDIQITESQLQELKVALDTLYGAFDYDFIPMWDIAKDWFDSLPRIISGQSWTPMLLQSVLRDYSTQLQYKTIPRIEQRQQHAAIVEVNSSLKDYSDLVYCALKAEYPTPSIKIHRNELFDLLIKIGLWPEDVSPSYGNAFNNLFKDNFHFHVSDKNTVEVG